MITIKDVSVTYTLRGNKVNALDKLSMDIPKKDYLSIIGPSGCGKSTLLQAMGGMLTPDSGEILFDNESLFAMPKAKRAEMRRTKAGFVFQRFNLVPYLTALENVQVPLLLSGTSEAEQDEKASALLSRVGLGDRLDHKPSELSVGQQQRVALARMLANDPEIIFADEPTGALDPETAEQVLDFFETMNNEGRTIIMVTHDLSAAKRAKRIIRMADGRIVDQRDD